MLPTTSLAPPFMLPDQNGILVSLAGLRGRWIVLYFYPKDDTPGCTTEACEFTAALPVFSGLHAEVIGCSADGAASHTAFINKHKLGVRLLTDADRSVMRSYGAFGKKMRDGIEVEGVIRSTVLIAPDGTVAHHWENVKAEGHAEQVRTKLMELQGHQAPVQNAFTWPATETGTAKAAGVAKPASTKTPAKKTTAKKPVAKRAAAASAAKKNAKKPAAKVAAAKKSSTKGVAKKRGAKKAGKVTAKPAAKTAKTAKKSKA
ncbi:MAG TPA: peroxiredoxin [Planctomycetota bacterium]